MNDQELYDANRDRLGQLATRAIRRGLAPADFVVVCIDVDTDWRPLVDVLMPDHDWQAYRDRGETPIARGSVMRDGLGQLLAEVVPGIAGPVLSVPDRGTVHAVVMVQGRATVYQIAPTEDRS